MSDIPLHILGRTGKTRAGYAPLNDAQENSTDMHTGVLRAAATRGTNASLKGKGKQRERYLDADDFDEEATLLGNERALEDVEEGAFGEQSNGLRASSRVSGRLSAQYVLHFHVQEQRSSTLSRTRTSRDKSRSRTIPFRPGGMIPHRFTDVSDSGTNFYREIPIQVPS